MNFLSAALTVLMTLVALSAHAQGDAAAGREKAATCTACHGVDGNSTVPMWPKIAGQHAPYLVRHVTLIKDGARPVPEMVGIVAGLSDQDIADLAAYYAEQTTSIGVADRPLVAAGAKLYRAGNPETGTPACMSCHGPAGQGNPLSGYPKLAGQHAQYTAKMLASYQDGVTWGDGDPNSLMMTEVAKYLTEEEIRAVSGYLQGLHLSLD